MMKTNDYFHYENQARAQGYSLVAGGDEAGRGPWAGPVFAAFVVLPDNCKIDGLDDSKKLSRAKRRRLFEEIKSLAVGYGIGIASADEIDKINILEGTRLAFKRAFDALFPKPQYVLLDFIKLPWLTLPYQAFPQGESKSASIAAASILAKESRDLHMERLDSEFPGYGFGRHMGYGTALHQAALQNLGPCEIHRRTFKPIKKLIEASKKGNETLF